MGAGAGFMDGSICYRIEVNVVSMCIMTGASFGIPMVIAFCQKSIGGVVVGKISLQNVWYVCTCLSRGKQVDGLPRAASFRKSALCEEFAQFGRPCRGLKPSRVFACN